jgi:hypothetical protein
VGHLEDIPERIAHHRPSIAVGRVQWCLESSSPRLYRGLEGEVCVIDIDVQEAGEGVALARRGDHDQRIADTYLGRASRFELAIAIEHSTEEFDLRRHIADHQARSHRVISGTRNAARHG